MNKLYQRALLASFIMMNLTSCKIKSTDHSDTSAIINNRLAKWTNAQAIPVCFMNAGDVDAQVVNDLKAFVQSEYHSKTSVRFTGWNNCTTQDYKSQVIRINFDKVLLWVDNNPAANTDLSSGWSYVGPVTLGTTCAQDNNCDRSPTMNIQVGRNGRYPTGENAALVKWTKATFIHEFGHALGLEHEHARKDSPACAAGPDSRTKDNISGGFYVGAYDQDSVMNYCSKNYQTLSAGDVAALSYLYPSPLPAVAPTDAYRLQVTSFGRCLKSSNNAIVLAECNADANQLFNVVFNGDGSFLLRSKSSNKCIDSESVTEGAAIVEKECQATTTQRMYLRPVSPKTYRLEFASQEKCVVTNFAIQTLASDVKLKPCIVAEASILFEGSQAP